MSISSKLFSLFLLAAICTPVFGADGRSDYDLDNDGLIEIDDLADLNEIRNHLDGSALYGSSSGCPISGCNGFELTTDLNFDTNDDGEIDSNDSYWNGGEGWVPLGRGDWGVNQELILRFNAFSGIFNGNGFSILNLVANRPGTIQAQGLFGLTDGAEIRNIALEGKLTSIKGGYAVGALVGYADETEVRSTYAMGLVEGTSNYVGGLVGYGQLATLEGVHFSGSVRTTGGYVGGLVGMGLGTSIIAGFSTASVQGDGIVVGGLAGEGNIVKASFASGLVKGDAVNAQGEPRTAALVGFLSYANLEVSDSHWAIDTTNHTASVAGISFSSGTYETSANGGASIIELKCPVSDNDNNCTNNTLYYNWSNYLDDQNNPYWNFGTSNELPGLNILGRVIRDGDGDGSLDQYDSFPTEYAASADDGDGAPDAWTIGCDENCRNSSGLPFDFFPNNSAAYADADFDGLPDFWASGCDVTCQNNSGLTLDQFLNDTDNDGINNTVDTDDTNDGIVDADEDGDGLIEISALSELNAIRFSLSGLGQKLTSESTLDTSGCPAIFDGANFIRQCFGYELTQSIDFDTNSDGVINALDEFWNEGLGWEGIGRPHAQNPAGEPFSAIFEGNSFEIRNLFINQLGTIDHGLFGRTNSAVIRNTTIAGPEFSVTGGQFVGGLIARATNTIVDNCHVLGGGITSELSHAGGILGYSTDGTTVTNSSASTTVIAINSRIAGGLIGYAADSSIEESFFDGAVSSGRDATGAGSAGGLAGFANNLQVNASFALGSVTSTGQLVGGLIGLAMNDIEITNSFSAVTVISTAPNISGTSFVGGIVGGGGQLQPGSQLQINFSFAVGRVSGPSPKGGLVPSNTITAGAVTDSYWSVDSTSVNTSSGGGIGLTLEELKCPTSANNSNCARENLYVGWDTALNQIGNQYWDFGSNEQLPGLFIQARVFRDGDGDGVFDEFDAFPFNFAAFIDEDGDGSPQLWNPNCDLDCQQNSGLYLDTFPNNPSESLDSDGDGTGDNADSDDDNDGVEDASDAFPLNSTESMDTDGDGIGNNTDLDDDNDGVADLTDAFPLDPSESIDSDNDGIGNNADSDDDNDGVEDASDAFPSNSTESVDTDGDGIGNNADLDDDNDSVADIADAFPLDPSESIDSDNDGIGNNADSDDDNDGVEDASDAFPLNSTESVDTDGDGIGNNTDLDDDNDGVADLTDAFPLDPSESIDSDNDGIGNNADSDDDNDGVEDASDAFPLNSTESVDTDGDGIGNNADSDDDNDGVEDASDAFPLNSTESVDTDDDGIGNNADLDDDNDGIPDTEDPSPLVPDSNVDTDGDGIPNVIDLDDDNDGVEDNVDAFPLDASESLDSDGDGFGNNADLDDDADQMPDDYELTNGFDPLSSDDALLDFDNDGITNLEEFQSGSNPLLDDVPPVLTIPSNIIVNSTGPLTMVDMGVATAFDAKDGNIIPTADDNGPFRSGRHFINWNAIDQAGNLTSDTQIIDVIPLVSFNLPQQVQEGSNSDLIASLNGPAVSYPVFVPFNVSGTAENPTDHDLVSGEIVINSGTTGSISFQTINDGVSEGNEDILVSMGTPANAVRATNQIQQITIIEDNIAPIAQLAPIQNNLLTSTIVRNGTIVEVNVAISDPNPNDNHTFDWRQTDNNLIPQEGYSSSTFTFEPSNVLPGVYELSVIVSDDGPGTLSTRVSTLIRVINSAPILGDGDIDGDGISDQDEGHHDSDADGIPDYLDYESPRYLLPFTANDAFLQVAPGLILSLGTTAFHAQANSAFISIGDIENFGGIDGSPGSNIIDNYYYPSGLASFKISGLQVGTSANVVIPLNTSVPAGAVYRKYDSNSGWFDFIEDASNIVSSAPGSTGICPAPGSSLYSFGLKEGDFCVQLTIQDGGPNDQDAIENGSISDPGGLGLVLPPLPNIGLNNTPLIKTRFNRDAGEQVVLGFAVLSDSVDAEIRSITLTASGELNELSELEGSVNVYVDQNKNGIPEAQEFETNGSFNEDNGELIVVFPKSVQLSVGETRLLVTYTF